MLKKIALAGAGVALLVSPLFVSAQTAGFTDACASTPTVECLQTELAQLVKILNLLLAARDSHRLQLSATVTPDVAQNGITATQFKWDISNAPAGSGLEIGITGSVLNGSDSTMQYRNILSSYLLDGTTGSISLADGHSMTSVPSHGTFTFTPNYAAGFLPVSGPVNFTVIDSTGNVLARTSVPLQVLTPAPSATVDTHGVFSSSGTFTLSGSAQNTTGVVVALVPVGYQGSWDFASILNAHNVFEGTAGVAGNRWSAGFAGVPVGAYTLLAYDFATRAALVSSGTVVVGTISCQPLAPMTCPVGQHVVSGSLDSNGCVVQGTCVVDTTTLSVLPTGGSAPLTVTFTAGNTSNIGRIDFGDGQQLTAPTFNACVSGAPTSWCQWTPIHTYTAPGTYTATLLGKGCDSPAEGQISCMSVRQILGTATITVAGSVNVSTAVPTSVQNIKTADDFVRYLYRCVLGREGEASGVAGRMSRLTSGTVSVQGMYRELLGGVEYQNRGVDNTKYISDLYRCVLFREGEASGITTRVQALSSLSREMELSDLLSGAEFTQSVLPVLQKAINTPQALPPIIINQTTPAASNVANVLTALEAVLKAMLAKLAQ